MNLRLWIVLKINRELITRITRREKIMDFLDILKDKMNETNSKLLLVFIRDMGEMMDAAYGLVGNGIKDVDQ
jgi:hypothetical protein